MVICNRFSEELTLHLFDTFYYFCLTELSESWISTICCTPNSVSCLINKSFKHKLSPLLIEVLLCLTSPKTIRTIYT